MHDGLSKSTKKCRKMLQEMYKLQIPHMPGTDPLRSVRIELTQRLNDFEANNPDKNVAVLIEIHKDIKLTLQQAKEPYNQSNGPVTDENKQKQVFNTFMSLYKKIDNMQTVDSKKMFLTLHQPHRFILKILLCSVKKELIKSSALKTDRLLQDYRQTYSREVYVFHPSVIRLRNKERQLQKKSVYLDKKIATLHGFLQSPCLAASVFLESPDPGASASSTPEISVHKIPPSNQKKATRRAAIVAYSNFSL